MRLDRLMRQTQRGNQRIPRTPADWLTKTRPTRRSWINCGEASRFNTSRSRAYRFRRLRGCSVTKGRVRSTTLSCVGPAVRHPPRATRSSFPRRDKAFSRANLPQASKGRRLAYVIRSGCPFAAILGLQPSGCAGAEGRFEHRTGQSGSSSDWRGSCRARGAFD